MQLFYRNVLSRVQVRVILSKEKVSTQFPQSVNHWPLCLVCLCCAVCVWGRECLKKKNSYFMICTRKMSKLMIWMNDLNAWHHICFLMHVLSVATRKGQQRRRTEEGKRKIIGVCFFCCLISRQSLISLIIKLLSKQRQAGRNWPSPAAYTSGGRV